MRYLVRLGPPKETVADSFPSIKSIGSGVGADVRNPKRTSRGSLEVDVFVPSAADLETFLATIEPLCGVESVRNLSAAPRYMAMDELFAEARRCFNSERYWECHEVLEGAWRTMQGRNRSYVQGLILLCAAFVHHQKDQDQIALGVLGRALKQLTVQAPTFYGIDSDSVLSRAEGILATGQFVPFEI